MAIAVRIVRYPGPEYDRMIRARGTGSKGAEDISAGVSEIVRDIRDNGDRALVAITRRIDGIAVTPATIRYRCSEIAAAAGKAPPAVRTSIVEAAARIREFHKRQMPTGFTLRTAEGTLEQLVKPLKRVGVYVPGGYTVYPSSVLMTVIPAQIAGVEQIAVATPPRKQLDPALAFALTHLGVTEVYRVGGAQAVAAMAFGTRMIPRVDKIVGPGSAWVAEAKRQVFGAVDIDSVAGPSEVVILADSSADPAWVALDMLAQAEHGSGDETAVCVTEDRAWAKRLADALVRESAASPVREVFDRLAPCAVSIVVTRSRKRSIAYINECAPEHLQIMTKTAKEDLCGIRNCGAVFVGIWAPVALGDYFIGTNHVLPTGGAARFASPLGVESFVKRMSVARIGERGLRASAPYVSVLARAEKFVHHAMSVERRAGSEAGTESRKSRARKSAEASK